MNEPKESGQVSVVKIPVLRVGDTSKVSIVRVHTKDGSATSGEDYHPISEGRYLFCFCLFVFLSGQIHIKIDRNVFVKFLSFLPEIEFKEGETEHFVEVEILYDSVREMREAFTVHLKPDENMVAETKVQIKSSYHII